MLEKNMRNSIEQIQKQYDDLKSKADSPEVISNIKEYTKTLKRIAQIEDIVEQYRLYLSIEQNIIDAKEILKSEKDDDMITMAKNEINENNPLLLEASAKLKLLLLPQDPLDDKNVIIEIRGAAGGDEANIFAADLFSMYQK
jgi:peptide chain release factor 1